MCWDGVAGGGHFAANYHTQKGMEITSHGRLGVDDRNWQ